MLSGQLPYIIDTTLRDGEQAPGLVFHPDEKIHIASLLDKMNIPELEIGTPAMGKDEINIMRRITSSGFNFKTLAWCRSRKEDIDAARSTGAHGINISFPVSKIHLEAMGKNYAWVLKNLNGLVNYAKDYFGFLAIGAQDASRSEYEFLHEFSTKAYQMGVNRIRIADTVGILNPEDTATLFKKLSGDFPDKVFEFHGHNDLGMATANSITAIRNGASCISTTVNGIGERAGNAALEEVLMALEFSYRQNTGYNTRLIKELSDTVSSYSKIPVPQNKPVTGSKVYSHESGIHTSMLLKNIKTYQLIDTSKIGGADTVFVFGKHSGKTALINLLKSHKIHTDDSTYLKISKLIKDYACTFKKELSEKEIIFLSKEIIY